MLAGERDRQIDDFLDMSGPAGAARSIDERRRDERTQRDGRPRRSRLWLALGAGNIDPLFRKDVWSIEHPDRWLVDRRS